MKDTKLCIKCKYHGYFGAKSEDRESLTNVMCDYSGLAKDGTCLKKVKGGIIDRRGDKYEECLLFVEGKQIGRAKNSSYHVEKKIHRRMIDVNSERGKELPPKD